ncbi:MAG: hypothetical protein NZM34_13405 [Bernardetiaceae bacterium]|nr:hypothetical protein [Bernardetiaceae bacterium]
MVVREDTDNGACNGSVQRQKDTHNGVFPPLRVFPLATKGSNNGKMVVREDTNNGGVQRRRATVVAISLQR